MGQGENSLPEGPAQDPSHGLPTPADPDRELPQDAWGFLGLRAQLQETAWLPSVKQGGTFGSALA